jgi:hypothetical protein
MPICADVGRRDITVGGRSFGEIGKTKTLMILIGKSTEVNILLARVFGR